MVNKVFVKILAGTRVASIYTQLLNNYGKEYVGHGRLKCTKSYLPKERINLFKCDSYLICGIMYKSDIAGSDVYQQILKNVSIWKNPVCGGKNILHQNDKFNEYIRLLGNKEVNFSELFPTLQNSKYDFKDYKNVFKFKDKIFELAILLKCSPDEAYRFILKHEFLAQCKLTTLEKKVDLLLESGISLPDLKRDLWVLSYTANNLKARITKIKDLNLPMKCWMLRCQESTLNRSWEKREQDKAALVPFTNCREYLCNRLEMNECQLKIFSNKHPAVLKIKMVKLKKVLDYLFNEGFTASQIYATPRILCHSISTIKARLSILRRHDCEPRTLSLLCLSARAFETYIQKLPKPPP